MRVESPIERQFSVIGYRIAVKMKRSGSKFWIAIGAVVLCTAANVGFSTQVRAEDTVQLVDSSDLKFYSQSSDIQIGSPQATAALDQNMLGQDTASSASILSISVPRLTPNGFSLGVEISLEDSDHVQLQDHNRIYLEGSFGRVNTFETLALQAGTGILPSVMSNGQEPGSIAFLTRAASLNVDPVELSLSTSNPGLMVPQYAGVRLGYSSRHSSADRMSVAPRDRGFEVSLTSMVMLQSTNTAPLSFLDAATLGSEERAYNVGLNVGYRGFTLIASFLRGEGQINSSYESYDVGLEYDFGSWATSLAVGGYFGDSNGMSYANLFEIDHIYSVEIGASYAIRPWMKVQGRFQFFDYQTLLGSTLDGFGGTFFLGTSLGF